MSTVDETTASVHRVVVIGSGFGGLFATKALRKAPVEVTLIDRTSHHLFQPLLYQVATGILSEGEIAPSTREILRGQPNARVILGEVIGIDLDAHTVTSTVLGLTTVTPYDSLIVAAGASHSYFGNDGFARFAPGMKSLADAMELRRRIFGAYEIAEVETDLSARDAWLTFVVVGGGPTGVEMAGQVAELSRRGLKRNFASFDPADTTVILLEAGGSILTSYGEKLSRRAKLDLERVGVDVQLDSKVVDVSADGVDVQAANGDIRRIDAKTKIWAAGVSASPLGDLLSASSGAERNRSGQIVVEPDCSLSGRPEVFVVGDMMQLPGVPSVAQVAIQSGAFAAGQIVARLQGRPAKRQFRYHDKGTLATISRFKAIAKIGRLQLSGFVAWVLWLGVHLLYLIGFKNRISVAMHWAVTFFANGRSERTWTLPDRGLSTPLQDILAPGVRDDAMRPSRLESRS